MRAVVLPQLLTSTDSSWDVSDASMLVVLEANLIIICGMLPTLRKFFRHVAPKIIGESTYGRHSNKSSSGGRGGHNNHKLSNSGPGIVTFGSLPSTHKGGHRGYAKFDRGRYDGYAFALETIGGTAIPRHYDDNDSKNPAAGIVGVFRHGSKKGRVDTTVVAGNGTHLDDGFGSSGSGSGISGKGLGGGGSLSSDRVGVGRISVGSRDSQLPIMGGTGGGNTPSSGGIKATTRIEVSYDPAGTML